MTTLEPVDVEAIRADDALIEDIRAGGNPVGLLPAMLAALRDDVRQDTRWMT